jgi:predicted MarR family transcription regulator
MSGAPDTLAMFRTNQQKTTGKLLITGRDVESGELSFNADKATKSWIIDDDSEEYQMSGQRTAIIDLLRKSDQPMKIRDIAKSLDKNENSVRQLLFKLHRDGVIMKRDRGLYSLIVECHDIVDGKMCHHIVDKVL